MDIQSLEVQSQGLTPEEMRGKILDIEEKLKQMPFRGSEEECGQITIEPVHYFAEGLYAREITIPKGTVLTGKIHLFEHINIISQGDISVMTDEGIKRIKAPATIISKPGMKRIGFAHETTVWTTVHACQVKDGDEADKLLVVDSYEQFALAVGEKKCLSSQ